MHQAVVPLVLGSAPRLSLKQHYGAGSLAALSSRVMDHSQGAVMLVRGIAKPLARFAVAKFRLVLHCSCKTPFLSLVLQPPQQQAPCMLADAYSVWHDRAQSHT